MELKNGEFKTACRGCHGGCVMGGGQPADVYDVHKDRIERSSGLFRLDEESETKSAENNPIVDKIYSEIIQGREHELLHCER